MKRLLLLFGLVNENACINGSHSHACALVGYQIETIAIVSQLAGSPQSVLNTDSKLFQLPYQSFVYFCR